MLKINKIQNDSIKYFIAGQMSIFLPTTIGGLVYVLKINKINKDYFERGNNDNRIME